MKRYRLKTITELSADAESRQDSSTRSTLPQSIRFATEKIPTKPLNCLNSNRFFCSRLFFPPLFYGALRNDSSILVWPMVQTHGDRMQCKSFKTHYVIQLSVYDSYDVSLTNRQS